MKIRINPLDFSLVRAILPRVNKYIAMDVETGGLTPETSILTAFFAVLDQDFNVTDEIDFNLKPEDGIYRVTAGGLMVNKINLVEHDKTAILVKDAKTPLYEFLKKNNHGEKLIPIGHNVAFDISRIKRDGLISEGSWETFVSYRCVDTGVVCQFLRAAGLFPEDVSGSLGSLVGYFRIPSIGELHNAKTDTLQTVAVLKELLKIVKYNG